MEPPDVEPRQIAARVVERELRLVRDAIALVASGRSHRVVVAGLQVGEAILGEAEALGRAAGVRIVPLWSTDEGGADIAVEWVEP